MIFNRIEELLKRKKKLHEYDIRDRDFYENLYEIGKGNQIEWIMRHGLFGADDVKAGKEVLKQTEKAIGVINSEQLNIHPVFNFNFPKKADIEKNFAKKEDKEYFLSFIRSLPAYCAENGIRLNYELGKGIGFAWDRALTGGIPDMSYNLNNNTSLFLTDANQILADSKKNLRDIFYLDKILFSENKPMGLGTREDVHLAPEDRIYEKDGKKTPVRVIREIEEGTHALAASGGDLSTITTQHNPFGIKSNDDCYEFRNQIVDIIPGSYMINTGCSEPTYGEFLSINSDMAPFVKMSGYVGDGASVALMGKLSREAKGYKLRKKILEDDETVFESMALEVWKENGHNIRGKGGFDFPVIAEKSYWIAQTPVAKNAEYAASEEGRKPLYEFWDKEIVDLVCIGQLEGIAKAKKEGVIYNI